jgi:hypothetical protein
MKVHAAAGYQIEGVFRRNCALARDSEEVNQYVVVDARASQTGAERRFPSVQVRLALGEGLSFVDEIVGRPAEPVDRIGTAAQVSREEAAGKVKAFRAGFGGAARLII